MNSAELTPSGIVRELDRYIVGQARAKRAVAIALRNRYRRNRLSEDMREEVYPKNILMIGPTGVGKTEIARRLSNLVGAPFIKVEATKYTEVGYVGRDVESMVRDLVEASIRMVRATRMEDTKSLAEDLALERLVDILEPATRAPGAGPSSAYSALSAMLGGASGGAAARTQAPPRPADMEALRNKVKEELHSGFYDVRLIEIEVEEQPQLIGAFGGPQFEEMGQNVGDLLGSMLPKRRTKKRVTVAEAKSMFEQEEAAKLVDNEALKREAVQLAEENGIIFIDEMDKIAGGRNAAAGGPDVSREGVQRDILPIVEGSTVITKYGPVNTDHVLFVGAGAFHVSKPSDMIPELQGRFPIRVELDSLSKEDFKTILTQPRNALIEQYKQLLSADGVTLDFTDSGIDAIARLATLVNEQTENIGARRLHTMMEKVLESVSYGAPERGGTITVDEAYVEQRLADIVKNQDLSQYIL